MKHPALRWIVFYLLAMLRTGAVCFVASSAVAALMHTREIYHSPGELVSIVLWTMPFAIGLALVSLIVLLFFSLLPRWLTYPTAVGLGGIGGFLWAHTLYALFINPYFGTFSIPVGFVWITGGISGFVAIAGVGAHAHKGNFGVELTFIALLCLAVGLGSDAVALQLSESRQVSVVWIKWQPGPEPLALDTKMYQYLSDEERARLLAMNLGGRAEWKGTDVRDRGPLSRMVIVMQFPVDQPVELALSASEGITYIQQSDGSWRLEPPSAPTLSRTLRLERHPQFPHITSAVLQVSGGTYRFGGINWTGQPLPP